LEIEVQGAKQVMKKDPNCVPIFIAPPSLDELERRLRGRKSEDETSIQKRLNIALNELGEIKLFKYNHINDTIRKCAVEHFRK
jgi:guanylate kinase